MRSSIFKIDTVPKRRLYGKSLCTSLQVGCLVILPRTIMAPWLPFSLLLLQLPDGLALEYLIVGVSGGLQKNFPEHPKLDYVNKETNEQVGAVFLGRGLVRGYQSYLDVMQEGWRQYDPTNRLINCNVFATGCWHHANEYWMYLVDARQFIKILMNEPRFLSITPDLGLVDLVAEETSDVIKHLAKVEIANQGKTITTEVAFPLVTAAWFQSMSHVMSPVLYTKKDGTQVTNFPQSLAKWAGMELGTTDGSVCQADMEAYVNPPDYWEKIRSKIQAAESDRTETTSKPMLHCERKARFGTSSEHARINFAMSPQYVQSLFDGSGVVIRFEEALVERV
jgi:hypothetical protein